MTVKFSIFNFKAFVWLKVATIRDPPRPPQATLWSTLFYFSVLLHDNPIQSYTSETEKVVILVLYYKQHYLVVRCPKLILNLVCVVRRCQCFAVCWLVGSQDQNHPGLLEKWAKEEPFKFTVEQGIRTDPQNVYEDCWTVISLIATPIFRLQICLASDTDAMHSSHLLTF